MIISAKLAKKHFIFLERSATIFTERLGKQKPLQPWKPECLILHCNESFFSKYGLYTGKLNKCLPVFVPGQLSV